MIMFIELDLKVGQGRSMELRVRPRNSNRVTDRKNAGDEMTMGLVLLVLGFIAFAIYGLFCLGSALSQALH